MLKLLADWLSTNWFTIFCTILGMGLTYYIYNLQKKDAASAAAERKKHAVNELRDVVESYIINKQLLTEQIIQNLIMATERDHAVVLLPQYRPISILQDVALRLQRSRYLDIPQKAEYSDRIENLIKNINEISSPIRTNELNTQILIKVQELEPFFIPESHQEAKKILTELTNLVENKRAFSIKNKEDKELVYGIVWTMLGGVISAVLSVLSGAKIEPIHFFSESSLPSLVLTLLGVAFALFVLSQTLNSLIRLERKTKQSSNSDLKDS